MKTDWQWVEHVVVVGLQDGISTSGGGSDGLLLVDVLRSVGVGGNVSDSRGVGHGGDVALVSGGVGCVAGVVGVPGVTGGVLLVLSVLLVLRYGSGRGVAGGVPGEGGHIGGSSGEDLLMGSHNVAFQQLSFSEGRGGHGQDENNLDTRGGKLVTAQFYRTRLETSHGRHVEHRTLDGCIS